MENGHNYSILSQIKFSELPREKVITLKYGKGDCMHLDENDSIKLIRELKSIENYWAKMEFCRHIVIFVIILNQQLLSKVVLYRCR